VPRCGLVDVLFICSTLMIEGVGYSETSLRFYETILHLNSSKEREIGIWMVMGTKMLLL